MYFFLGSPIYVIPALLLLIILPKYINHSIPFGENFKLRKEKSVKDLFTPKIR